MGIGSIYILQTFTSCLLDTFSSILVPTIDEEAELPDHVPVTEDILVIAGKVLAPQFLRFCKGLL
jgi:hypothetical protein